MANRKRQIVLRVPVTPEERALIQQKMAQLGTRNFSAYARKMLIDGYIVHMDTSDIGRRPQSCKKSASTSTRLRGVSTVPGLCTRRTLRTSRGRWHRYGNYKDTSYQVNAESGP